MGEGCIGLAEFLNLINNIGRILVGLDWGQPTYYTYLFVGFQDSSISPRQQQLMEAVLYQIGWNFVATDVYALFNSHVEESTT